MAKGHAACIGFEAAAAQAPPGQVVVVCSKETAVGALAAQQSGDTPVQLPLECIPREFTPGEIQGTQPDLETGVRGGGGMRAGMRLPMRRGIGTVW